jgi:heme exporter protein A
MKVWDYLQFFCELFGTYEVMEAAVKYLKISEFLEVECRELSAGWRRRVAIARLMLSNSYVWILDEPFVHLDSEGIERLENLITTKCAQAGMVIFSSHMKHTFPFLETLDLKGEWQ